MAAPARSTLSRAASRREPAVLTQTSVNQAKTEDPSPIAASPGETLAGVKRPRKAITADAASPIYGQGPAKAAKHSPLDCASQVQGQASGLRQQEARSGL